MRLADIGAQMSLDEVKGAQLAAREADERAALAKAQGVQGIVNYVGALGQIPELFAGPNAGAGADAGADALMLDNDSDIFNDINNDIIDPYGYSQNPFDISRRRRDLTRGNY
jgi:hypothetical protein